MIPSSITYTNNAGTSVSLGTADYPLTDFTMPTYQSNEPVKKMQFPGRWPTFSYPEYREFSFAGDILGDTEADYNTLAMALKSAFQPPMRAYTGRRHGTLDFVFYGAATHYYSYVILSSLETPKEANFPSVGTYNIVMTSFDPYLWTSPGVFSLAH